MIKLDSMSHHIKYIMIDMYIVLKNSQYLRQAENRFRKSYQRTRAHSEKP